MWILCELKSAYDRSHAPGHLQIVALGEYAESGVEPDGSPMGPRLIAVGNKNELEELIKKMKEV